MKCPPPCTAPNSDSQPWTASQVMHDLLLSTPNLTSICLLVEAIDIIPSARKSTPGGVPWRVVDHHLHTSLLAAPGAGSGVAKVWLSWDPCRIVGILSCSVPYIPAGIKTWHIVEWPHAHPCLHVTARNVRKLVNYPVIFLRGVGGKQVTTFMFAPFTRLGMV